MALQEAGQATIAYFYFDFTKPHERNIHGALLSLLTQLSAYSDSYCDIILSHIPRAFIYGINLLPSTETMITCLKEMLTLPVQGPVYIVLDALNECPHNPDYPSRSGSREELLDFLKDLVDLQLPNLHICVTSRPEIDIRIALEPLASYSISLHDQNGQKKDIEDYIRSYVYSGSDTFMTRWRKEDKEWVIEKLSERADGM